MFLDSDLILQNLVHIYGEMLANKNHIFKLF